MSQETTNEGLPNRWLLAGGGVLMQLALGAVYAWSVFRIPLSKTFGWSIQDVTWAFSLAILALGFAAFVGGLWMRRVGPRVVGITAAICYGLGVGLSGLASGNIWILWLARVLGGQLSTPKSRGRVRHMRARTFHLSLFTGSQGRSLTY
jgi:MFS family permease